MSEPDDSNVIEVIPINLICGISDGKRARPERLGAVYVAGGRVVDSDAAMPFKMNGRACWIATCKKHGTVGVGEDEILRRLRLRQARPQRPLLAVPMDLRLPRFLKVNPP